MDTIEIRNVEFRVADIPDDWKIGQKKYIAFTREQLEDGKLYVIDTEYWYEVVRRATWFDPEEDELVEYEFDEVVIDLMDELESFEDECELYCYNGLFYVDYFSIECAILNNMDNAHEHNYTRKAYIGDDCVFEEEYSTYNI